MAPTIAQQLLLAEAKIKNIQSQIQEIYELSKTVNANENCELFVTKAKRLETLRSSYEVALLERETMKMEADDKHIPKFSDKCAAINNLIDKVNMVLNPILEKRETERTIALSMNSSSSTTRNCKVKIEPLKIPNFDGSPENWTPFYQLFVELVHLNNEFSNLQKITILTSHLTGSARSIVTGIPPIAENYTSLFDTLVSRFQDKRVLGNYYLDKLFNFKPLLQESEKNLNSFLEVFVESSEAIKQLGITDLYDFVLLYLASKKLDSETMRLFDMSTRDSVIPKFRKLVEFVRSQVKIVGRTNNVSGKFAASAQKYAKPSPFFSKTSNICLVQNSGSPGPSRRLSNSFSSNVGTCGCPAKHKQLYKCELFTNLSPLQRWNVVKQQHACFNCLSFAHQRAHCKSTSTCNVSACGQSHHSLLHRDDKEFKQGCEPSQIRPGVSVSHLNTTGSSFPPASNTKTVACCASGSTPMSSAVLLATAIIRIKDQTGVFHSIRCLLDPGSESHLLTKDVCSRLGLQLHPAPTSVKGLGSADINVLGCSSFTFYSRLDNGPSYDVSALVVDKLIEALPAASVGVSNLQHVSHLSLADPDCLNAGKIDFLIGAELWPFIVGRRKVFGPPNTPVGLQSTLGYILMGRTSPDRSISHAHVCLVKEVEAPLDELLRRFWELDVVPDAILTSHDDQKCEEFFLDTHSRNEIGRYMVSLPFKESPTQLGDSLKSSMSRFFSLEKRLLKTPAIHSQYDEVIREYLADGTVIKLDDVNDQGSTFYLPHHGVHKPSSLSTPLRIVFNASARSSSGKSLNDLLYVGEKLQNDVFSILLNMRLFEHILCTDIRRMFLCIQIMPAHRKFLRFLWRSSPEDPLDVYEFTSLVFGLTCSPFLAQRVVKALCSDEGSKYPLAKEVVLRDAYVDDITTSVANESDLYILYEQLTKLFAAGGFLLSKWSSTSKKLLQRIPENERQMQDVSFDKDETTKVLGVQWRPLEDVFTCTIAVDSDSPTKRRMASILARIFDPLGLVSPVAVQLKLLLREMWMRKLGWDAELPEDLYTKCVEFKQLLPDLSSFSIPRYSTVTEEAYTMLIGFSDASEKAYGSVIYIRTQVPHKPPQVRLLCSRARIAPLKTETIPRLELCAAALLAKLMKFVIDTYKGRHTFNKILAYSDSTTALHWIRSHPSQWKIFVANRVAKIQENLDPRCWNFVPGHCNPADVLSRGTFPSDLIAHPMWLAGPDWLTLNENDWPSYDPIALQKDILSLEVKPQVFVVTVTPSSPLEPMLERVSRYRCLLRATAYVFRICRNKNIGNPIISFQEIMNAETYWVKLIQHKHFSNLTDRLIKKKDIPDVFKKLDVFLLGGVLRVGGRLRQADLTMDQKHPILLPKHDRFVNLLIDQYHVDQFHAGAQLVLSSISQKFWIMSAGVRIRSRLRCCHQCFRVNPREREAKMADLPRLRVQGFKCFATTGVDYAGPFPISWSRRRGARTEKAYLCLFICFAVKAVHLELVSDLTTAMFLAAFKRFLARRGPCAQLVSDCGTNFIGAKRELADLHQLVSSRQFNEQVGNDLSAKGVEWKMNPARAPHFGGLWESNIKSVKTHLKKIIGTQILTYEEMSTVLAQIEAIMNSRPLCKRLLSDPTAPEALTPAHFLTLGSTLNYLPMENVIDVPLNRLSRYQLINRFIQEFWKRWRNEYLHTLQLRGKWLDSTTPIEVGTVVILKEDHTSPLHWPLAIIEEVHPGKDNETRVVTVRTATSVFKRPVVKVCPLPSPE